jgi:hypothetical protein
MKIITQTFIIFIAVLILPSVLFGQAKSITSENYYAILKEAESKTGKQIRKEVQIQKLFSNGVITRTLTDTTEYLPPDKSRWIAVNIRGNVVERIEQIRIGNLYYRKEDNDEWAKRKVNEDSYGIGGETDDSTREYFIEDATIGKEKFQVLIEKTVNYNKTYFDERKIWINKKGLIIKKALTTSHIELPNIVSSVDKTYDYKVKPSKIEAPIK